MRSKYKVSNITKEIIYYKTFKRDEKQKQYLKELLKNNKQLWRVAGLSEKVNKNYKNFWILYRKNMKISKIFLGKDIVITFGGRFKYYIYIDKYKIGYVIGDFILTRKFPDHAKKGGKKKRIKKKKVNIKKSLDYKIKEFLKIQLQDY